MEKETPGEHIVAINTRDHWRIRFFKMQAPIQHFQGSNPVVIHETPHLLVTNYHDLSKKMDHKFLTT